MSVKKEGPPLQAFPFVGQVPQIDENDVLTGGRWFHVVDPVRVQNMVFEPGKRIPHLDESYLKDTSYFVNNSDRQTWRTTRREMRAWRKMLLNIFDVPTLKKIGYMEEAYEQDKLVRSEIEERFRQTVALRHRVEFTDKPVEPSEIRRGLKHVLYKAGKHAGHDFERDDFGLVLSNTRKKEIRKMSRKDFDLLIIKEGLKLAHNARVRYLDDPQIGLFRRLKPSTPDHVNELPGWEHPIKHLIRICSEEPVPKARYESTLYLSLFEGAVEYLLEEPKLDKILQTINFIMENYLFDPKQQGPTGEIKFVAHRDAESFTVDGEQIVEDFASYQLDPLVTSHKLSTRRVKKGDYPVQVNVEKKNPSSMLFKMMRKDSLDPEKNFDGIRLAVTVVNRNDVEHFLTDLQDACKRAGKPLKYEIEEDALDGKPYSIQHIGSHTEYQVKRVKLWFDGNMDISHVPFELSIYTLEAYANDEMGEFSRSRYILQRFRKSVFPLILPEDIYGPIPIDALIKQELDIIDGRERERALTYSSLASRQPHVLSEAELALSAKRIVTSIISQNSHLPRFVVSVGSNTSLVAEAIAAQFGMPRIISYDPKIVPVGDLVAEIKRLQGSHDKIDPGYVLLVDDVGEEARTTTTITRALNDASIEGAQVAYIAMKRDTAAAQIPNAHYGIVFSEDEYVVFPRERLSTEPVYQGSFGLVMREKNGKLELLIQKEQYADGLAYKLPGGMREPKAGQNHEETREKRAIPDITAKKTLRREMQEEQGFAHAVELSRRMMHRFPTEVHLPFDPDKGDVPANRLRMKGYWINGQDLPDDFVEAFTPPDGSDITAIEWMPVEKVQEVLNQPGYKALLGKFLEEYKSEQEVQAVAV